MEHDRASETQALEKDDTVSILIYTRFSEIRGSKSNPIDARSLLEAAEPRYQAPCDLWVVTRVNIGLVRLSPRHWPEVGHRAAKQQIKYL